MKQTLTISLLTEAQNGSFGKNEVQSMTRQEAIERISKAIICRACEDYLHEDTDPLTSSASAVAYAKAALNALLEEHK